MSYSTRIRRKDGNNMTKILGTSLFPKTAPDKDHLRYLHTGTGQGSLGSGLRFQIQQSHLLAELSQKILFLFFFLFVIAQIEYLPYLVSVMLAF